MAIPNYEQIDRPLALLREYFPSDLTVLSWYHFTHPKAHAPYTSLPLPPSGRHPEWAVLTREALRLYRQFVDFWIDERQIPNGELGNWYEDDSDLVQDWLDLIMISDPIGKYQRSLHLLAEGIATRYTLKGKPLIANGLNVRFTDTLHAYEEGLNVQPSDFVANYGDPVKFQRLLDTVARYDGFLLGSDRNGVRRFASQGKKGRGYFDTYKVSHGSPNDPYWFLLLHAGMVTAWYNNDPAVWEILESVARGNPGEGSEALRQALFTKTGNFQYLEGCYQATPWQQDRVLTSRSGALYPNTFLRVVGVNRQATVEAMRQDVAKRFASLGSEVLGWRDDRHVKNWVEWQFSGNESHLLEGLKALVRHLTFMMPVYTVAEQSGDRVSIPKQLISQLYLGGVPGSRNRHHYPDFAVSYRGFDDQFAARVLSNTKTALQVELYSFHEQPVSGELLVWSLEPGEYQITQNGGVPVPSRQQFLKRGEAISLTLPSRTPTVLTVKQESRGGEPELLGDAAISLQSIRWENGFLRVPVYNLGVEPLENVQVRLVATDGTLLSVKTIPALPGIVAWKLGVKFVEFPLSADAEVIVEVETPSPEITKRNNRLLYRPAHADVE